MKNTFFILTLSAALPTFAFAQKGIAPDEKFTATINTNYPAQVKFTEGMAANLKVPDGYRVSIAATGLGKPRIMAVNTDGSLYVTRRDKGDVLHLSGKDAKGRFANVKTIWKFEDVHGITIHNGWLYVASSKILKRGRINVDGSVTDTATLIKDLPEGSQHNNRMIAFGQDGMLYMTVGSDCNDCGETNKEHATMLQIKPDGSARRVFAKGLRNTIGFDWHPETKEIWGCDNGTDWRGDEIPPEELNKITDGGDYGWPMVFGKRQVDPTREDPVGGTKEGYAQTTVPAVITFPAHSAPIDFRFIGDTKDFSEFKNDALVAWHGSWNRKKPEGYKVQRIQYINGQPAKITDFFWGFLSNDGKSRIGRPAGIITSKTEGIIYVSDDENGVIYSITAAK